MTFVAFRLFQLVISCKPQPAIEKTGQMASRERFRRDAGQTGQKTGRPGKNGTSGNPMTKSSVVLLVTVADVFDWQVSTIPRSLLLQSFLLSCSFWSSSSPALFIAAGIQGGAKITDYKVVFSQYCIICRHGIGLPNIFQPLPTVSAHSLHSKHTEITNVSC